MKKLTLILAALLIAGGASNIQAQPGWAGKGKEKNMNSPKARGEHDNRNKKRGYNYYDRDENIRYHGREYIYSGGRYYDRSERERRIYIPPYGIRVSIIPRNCFSVTLQGVPYFYFEGVFYRSFPGRGFYEVVVPPVGIEIPELPPYGVNRIIVNGRVMFECDHVYYEPFHAGFGTRYRVVRAPHHRLYSYNY